MWFVDRKGEPTGPIDSRDCNRLIARGEILAETLVWQEGWPDWRPAREVLAQFGAAPPPAPARHPASASREGAGGGAFGPAAEAAVTASHHRFTGFFTSVAPIAALLSGVADFLKPVIELTRPGAIIAPILALAYSIAAKAAPALSDRLLTLRNFCLWLGVCCLAWWGLQTVLPRASGNGALVEIVPGAGKLQERLVRSFERVEQRTKRVGDILDKQAQEDRKEREERKRQSEAMENERTDAARKAIAAAGYAQDADGYVKAITKRFTNLSAFDDLKIELTADAVTKGLRRASNMDEIRQLTFFIEHRKDVIGLLRPIGQALFEDGDRLRRAFSDKNSRQTVCDPRTVKLAVAEKALAEICRLDDRLFARKYARFHSLAYSRIGERRSESERYSSVDEFSYSKNDLAALSTIRVPGKLSLKTLQDCKYYVGAYSFFYTDGLNPYGSLEEPGSVAITSFDATSFAFEGYPIHAICRLDDVLARRKPQCRARVLVASYCEGARTTVIKVLQRLD